VPFLIEVVEATGAYSFEIQCAIQALGKIGPPSAGAVPALRRRLHGALGAPRCPGCLYMIEALGRIGPAAREALPEIDRAANHSDDSIRRVAAEALKKIESGAPEKR
jgi:hypothetical protein